MDRHCERCYDFNCNLEKYLSDAKEKKLHEVLQEAIDSNSKKFLSDALKEGMTTGIGNAANAIVLQANEILSPENMDEDIYKDIFGIKYQIVHDIPTECNYSQLIILIIEPIYH